MWGTLEGAMEKERREAERKGEQKGIPVGIQEGKKMLSLNMLKKGFDYKTVAEISEVSVDQVKVWEKENDSPS